MKEKYMKKLNLELTIDTNINEVKKIIENTWDYLENPNCDLDSNDVKQQLDDAEIILNSLQTYLEKLEEEYEKNIKELKNE